MRGVDLRTTARPFISPLALAEYLDVSRRTIYFHIERGEIPAIRVGRQLRIPVEDARKFAGLPPSMPRPVPILHTDR